MIGLQLKNDSVSGRKAAEKTSADSGSRQKSRFRGFFDGFADGLLEFIHALAEGGGNGQQ
jgi:hypothetical protein